MRNEFWVGLGIIIIEFIAVIAFCLVNYVPWTSRLIILSAGGVVFGLITLFALVLIIRGVR